MSDYFISLLDKRCGYTHAHEVDTERWACGVGVICGACLRAIDNHSEVGIECQEHRPNGRTQRRIARAVATLLHGSAQWRHRSVGDWL